VGVENFRFNEFVDVTLRGLRLLTNSTFDFRMLAIKEMSKYSKTRMVSLASELAEGVRAEHYTNWGRPGIRAQLINTKKQKLEMDFVLEGDDKSMHVLNAVSPAFTCSIPFSEHVCKQIVSVLH
jgi:L-2-hydroxyglutarate oxidase LhgO